MFSVTQETGDTRNRGQETGDRRDVTVVSTRAEDSSPSSHNRPTPPPRTGVISTGSYWGAAGEQIDLLFGNLNYAIPLIQARGRGSAGAAFALSYNSQIWRQSGGTPSLLGRDLGFGLGWTLQAVSLLQVLNSYYVFTDSTGAQYKLDQNTSGVWTSREGTYAAYDSTTHRLYSPDGSFWAMTVQSAAGEPDAGTLYPSSMQDTNGNYIQFQYAATACPAGANTCGRITQITDARGGYPASYWFTYSYLHGADLFPHLTGINDGIRAAEDYSFTYGYSTLASPFTGTAFGMATGLQTVTVLNLNIVYSLQYGQGTGELTQVTTPTGGSLGWGYRTYTYAGSGVSYREVQTRQMSPAAGVTYSWNLTLDSNPTLHASAVLSDLGANASKVWTFGGTGLATSYEERGPGGVAVAHADYVWTTDAAGKPYVGTVVNTRNPGVAQVQSKSTQSLDTNGNITQAAVYEYGNLVTAARTYSYLYLTGGNYLSRHILTRLTQVTVTVGQTATTLLTNTYDNYNSFSCDGGVGIAPWPGGLMHDDANYGTGFVYRGNVTLRISSSGSANMRYQSTGVVQCSQDGAGRTMSSTPSLDTGYSLPGVITPNGNANLATTLTYSGSWAVTSLTGPNGAKNATTYDGWGRPTTTKIPDGAVTTYGYAYVKVDGTGVNQQTAMLGTGTAARWKRTTLDGFGRVVRVESGNGLATTPAVSQVDTQYAPCACSPLGKMWRVSMPYAPSGAPIWTTYTYDGSGRTLTVTAPDGSVTRTEYLSAYGSYTGNLVRMTDPAGKWKIQQTDAIGNLIRVIEPNPGGGADWITNYTYDVLGHLTVVSMPRSNGTQERTFLYTGVDLTSARNPENGLVTYQYDASHHVTKRTDAKGQETRYTYDAYGRLTEVQHWAGSPLVELTQQRVDYSYDTNPLSGSYSQKAWGRLAAGQCQ